MYRKFLAVALLLAGFWCLGQQEGRSQLIGQGVWKSVASSTDPATTAWVNAVISAGGTVSGGRQTIVNTEITCLKSASLFTITDRLWNLAAENTFQANIDLVNLGTFTINGSPTFTANHGYAGDAAAAYLDTNFNPATAGSPNFVRNSAHLAAYVQTNRTTTNTYADVAWQPASGATINSYILPRWSDTNLYLNINETATHTYASANSTAKGYYVVSRTGASATQAWQNGASLATTANASVAISGATNIEIFASNNGGQTSFSSDQISAVHFGAGLNATQLANYSSCVNAYHTSLGIAVYP